MFLPAVTRTFCTVHAPTVAFTPETTAITAVPPIGCLVSVGPTGNLHPFVTLVTMRGGGAVFAVVFIWRLQSPGATPTHPADEGWRMGILRVCAHVCAYLGSNDFSRNKFITAYSEALI